MAAGNSEETDAVLNVFKPKLEALYAKKEGLIQQIEELNREEKEYMDKIDAEGENV
jgi:hypothetical protein